jgi:glutaredoxin
MSDKMFKKIMMGLGGLIGVIIIAVASLLIYNQMNSTPLTIKEEKVNPNAKYAPRSDAANQLSPSSAVWNPEMTLGKAEAENHFIEYTDPFCPYCAKFNRALHSNLSDFSKEYLDTGKIQFEVRLVSVLTDPENSNVAGAYAYCAAEQGKFWDFYPALLDQIDADYFSKGIGSYHGAPDIPFLENSFYDAIVTKAGLDSGKIGSCLASGTGERGLGVATQTAKQGMNSGVPLFIFNDFKTSGFEGDYSRIKQMIAAGGVS